MENTRVINLQFSKYVLRLYLLLGSLCLAATASAADYRAGSLRIENPWAIATPKGAKVGAGYMKITNEGTQPDRLIALSSPAARKVSIHDMVKEGDVVKMRPLDQGLEIKPGETVELVPGGKHIMFEELVAGLVAGTPVQGMLQFEKAGTADVDFAVQPMGTRAAPTPPAHAH
jgi:periplasmic copper chaperone A